MSRTGQVWTHVKTYDDATGPGYSTRGVELFRGPKHNLEWAPAGSENSKLYPAYLRIQDKQNAFLILYNPEVRREAVIPIEFQSPIKVRDDSIDSRVVVES